MMETYKWDTIKAYASNEEAMSDYLDNHLLQCFNVIFRMAPAQKFKTKIQAKYSELVFRVMEILWYKK